MSEDKISPAVQLVADVKEAISKAEQSGDVRKGAIDFLANEEIAKRRDLLVKALLLRRDAETAVRKASKFDVKNYGADGAVVFEGYSGKAAEELKKAKEKLDKIDKAIAAAISSADYELIRKLGDQKPQGEQSQEQAQ
jgi:hypothetical protein